MEKTARDFCGAVLPVFIHFAAVSFLSMAGETFFPGTDTGLRVTGVTVLAAAMCTPLFTAMYRRDLRRGRFPAGECSDEKKRRWVIPAALLFALCLAAGAACSAAAGAAMRLLGMYRLFSNETQEMLLSSPPALQIIGIGLIVPVFEELLYRGLVYGRVRSLIPRRWAMILCSLLFATGHGNVIQALYAFPMAILLIALYERDRSLAAPVLFHIGANMFTVVMHLLGAAAA